MPAGPFTAQLLDTTAASTARAWTSICLLNPGSSLIVSGLEAGGRVQVWMSNLDAPPTALPSAGDGTVQWGSDITADEADQISATYRWVSVIKSAAAGSPTETKAVLTGRAFA
jgi:hypothetical protein